MIVGDTISLYSEYYGWVFYGVIWDVLAATGLALVPLFVIVGKALLDIREQGSAMGLQSDNVLAPVEAKLFVLLLVLGLAVVPNAATTVTPLSFQYVQRADAYGTAAGVVAPGGTNSTIDNIDSPVPTNIATVSVPPWWLLVTKISHGITHAVSQSVDTSGASIKAVKNMASLAHISNPALRASVEDFVQSCYAPALRKFDRERKGDATLAHNQGGGGEGGYTNAEINGIDLTKMNSEFLLNTPGYYNAMTTTNVAPNVAPNATNSVEYEGGAIAGRQTCSAFWGAIEAEIVKEATRTGYINGFDVLVATGKSAFTAADRDELIVDTYIGRLATQYKGQSDKLVAARSFGGESSNTGMGIVVSSGEMISDTIGVYFLFKAAYMADLFADATIYTMTALRAMAMIILIMALPIGMLVSGYSLKFLVSGATLLFTLIFLTAIWDIAGWAENELTVSLFPSGPDLMNFIAGGVQGPEVIKKHLSLSMAGAALYLFLPSVFIWVMTAAGSSHLGRTNIPGSSGSATGVGPAKSAFTNLTGGGSKNNKSSNSKR